MGNVALFPIAFGFVSSWLLWGLALGAIPLVIHLLHKRRYRESPWAAMRFLLEAARKNSRRIRIEQLLLLMVRMLIFLLLVTALAQPHMESFGISSPVQAATHRIIVIDASFSMGYRSGDQSLFEQAQETAASIVEGAGQGDAFNLVRLCDSEPRAIVREPSFQKEQMAAEVSRLPLTDERGVAAATLQKVIELLEEAPHIKQKQVVIISDFQRASWTSDSSGGAARLRQLLRTIGQKGQLALVDVGQEEAGNTAVTSLLAEEPFVVVGRPIHLQATLRHFGRAPVAGQTASLYVDERFIASTAISRATNAGGDARADFTHTFATAGEHQIDVRIDDDSLAADNRRWLALPVKAELRVLLVNGRRSGEPAGNATFYLEKTFAPATVKEKWSGITRVTTINDGELITREDLSRYDCIFLCNVAAFEPREAGILRAYLEGGGGVVFCLGDQVQAESYNRELYHDGQGILPAKLGDRMGGEAEAEQAYEFDAAELDHPIVRAFAGNPGTGLESTLVLTYVRAEPREDAAVALRFNTGDPAIVDAAVGRGRAILVTTSADTRWGAWPVQRSFPPIMHEIVHYAVTGRWEERQRLVGESLARVYPVRAFTMRATVKRPDDKAEQVRLTESEQFAHFVYRRTDRRGLYTVELGVPLSRSELFALNVDPRESDLAKAGEAELKAELLAGIDFTYLSPQRAVDVLMKGERREQAAAADRGSLTRWLLAATLCLIAVEQLMAWKFYYGFLLLYAAAAAGFVAQAAQQGIVWGVLLAAMLLAGFILLYALGRRRGQLT